MNAAGRESTNGTHRLWSRRAFGAGVVALAVAGLLVGCSDDDDSASVEQVTSSTTVAGASTTAAPSGGGSGGTARSSGGQSGGGAAAAPPPVIDTFETPENIDCHNGNFQMFTATWTTTNATKTTISIDGGGVYKTYAGDDEASLPFNCSSSHTFLLTAYGSDGKTATRSVTLQPRNVQGSDTTEADE